MIGTLSMLALVVLGANGITPLVVVPFALGNALVGLTPGPEPVAGFWPRLGRVLPAQVLFAAVGYGLGLGFSQAILWLG